MAAEFVKSDFLEWSGKKRQFVLVAEPKRAVKFLRRLNSSYDKYDLRKPLHANTLHKIQNDLTQFFQLAERPNVHIIRPSRKNRALYRDAAQQYGKGWKVFAVPLQSDTNRLKVKRFNRKRVLVEVGAHIDYIKLYFNKKKLVKDLEAEVRRLYREASEGHAGLKYARILAGSHTIGVKFLEEKLTIKEIYKLMLKYNAKDTNNFWGNWLDGLEFARFNNQKEGQAYGKQKKKRTLRQKIRGR